MTDKFYVYRPLLDLIGFTEGTDKGDGYGIRYEEVLALEAAWNWREIKRLK